MFKRSWVVAMSAAAVVSAPWAAPASADSAMPLPLLPHVPFYLTDTATVSGRPVPLTAHGLTTLDATYVYNGRTRSVGEFLEQSSTRGFLVMRGDQILDERYFAGYSAASRFNSWSVGKSITSAAVGIAIAEGRIASVDDSVTDYVPELATSGYDGVSIRHVLQMSSGTGYDEHDYSDPTKGSTATTIRMVTGTSLPDQAAEITRERPAGTAWNYNSMDTFVLGWVVSKATGMSLAAFVEDRLWKPAGMETSALIGQDYAGNTIGYCCYHATVRDFARFGLLYLRNGRADGKQIVPRQWVEDSTRAQAPHLQPHNLRPDAPDSGENSYGYGYQWWLGDGDRGDYAAIGILGQFVYVSPADDIVIVKTSEDLSSEATLGEAIYAFRAIADAAARR
ncbi:serine hydrolase domain-containing protein [Nocardia farcinica]|uniref:serine hydrolase domain-containing protein n=1 Tax=Nocardia farcinica TaxID=37329 RepID=UPI001892F0B5|nr:serine hydrolase [Nocardia farcinica]MBF6188942.1 serine hydrolase [Nocardia farcinica]MBF6309465.1 serine hydrolase [Nocardia farcinica]MBF6410697.1 serine hydrolase [Nocardia farcinica]MBF6522688.1 serine hydrolase [Nocardia farcinica]UEX20567.1 beta-lactamase family protein [Nocardia farcinica]